MLPDNLKFGSVAELVASQGGGTPDAAGFEPATRVLSYKELDERASALADVLRALGANRDPERFPDPNMRKT
jgi:non-ribosomal peptide synthetase component F